MLQVLPLKWFHYKSHFVVSTEGLQELKQSVSEIKNSTIRYSSSCKMDTQIKIKEENPFLDDTNAQNEGDFFTKNVTMVRNSDVLLDHNCDMAIKMTQVKPETAFLDFCLQNDRECLAKPETVICSSNCKINTYIKTETEEQALMSQNEREFLPEDCAMKVREYNSDDEIEVKEEPWWLERETSSLCDEIKDGNYSSVKSSRLYSASVSGDSIGKSPLPSGEVSSFYNGNEFIECESKQSDVTKVQSVEMYSMALGKNNLIRNTKRLHTCKICKKSFIKLSHLKEHSLIHEGKKPHKCNICERSFTKKSYLKKHAFIHASEKPHKCKTCSKSFSQVSTLKVHSMIHEGTKPHKCEVCEKTFIRLSHLKQHILIHDSKRAHKCQICGRSFTQLSNLKRHNLIHEDKKPHKCDICEKKFIRLSHLQWHNLIHEGKKPHKCEICETGFTRLSDLKSHKLIHEGKKPHKCEICDKGFTRLSDLKSHKLTHEGKRPHKCDICEKRFTHSSNLKRHNLIHQRHGAIQV